MTARNAWPRAQLACGCAHVFFLLISQSVRHRNDRLTFFLCNILPTPVGRVNCSIVKSAEDFSKIALKVLRIRHVVCLLKALPVVSEFTSRCDFGLTSGLPTKLLPIEIPQLLYFDCDAVFSSLTLTKAYDGRRDHAFQQASTASLHRLKQLIAAAKDRGPIGSENEHFNTSGNHRHRHLTPGVRELRQFAGPDELPDQSRNPTPVLLELSVCRVIGLVQNSLRSIGRNRLHIARCRLRRSMNPSGLQ